MGKRAILAALKRKGIEAKTCEYGQHVTPGEIVGAWTIELTDESEDLLIAAGVDEWDLEPDCFNAAQVLEWVDGPPDVRPSGGDRHGE